MSYTCAGGVDTVLVVQLGKETRGRVGLIAVTEGRRIEIDRHLRAYGVHEDGRTRTTDDEVFEMTYRFFGALFICRVGIIDDSTVAVVIADVFGYHEGVLE